MKTQPFDILDLGRRPYRPVLRLQEELVEKRKAGEGNDTLILVEHEPVYTLGRNAKIANVLVSPAVLSERGIDVVGIGRGGDVTYHGPGQLVGYPILDLKARGKGVIWYVEGLERTLVRTLRDFGIEAGTDPANRGVWVGNEKIAALGVRVTRGVTMHGFALNVAVDLRPYDWIVPCGLRDKGVTSMDKLVAGISMAAVKERVARHFGEILYGAAGEPSGREMQTGVPEGERCCEPS